MRTRNLKTMPGSHPIGLSKTIGSIVGRIPGAGHQPLSRYREKPGNSVARFLDMPGLAGLGARWPEAVVTIPLLALTGSRRSDMLYLRWRNIGSDALNREASKTRPSAQCRSLRHYPVPMIRTRSCFLAMPKARVSGC